MELHIADRLLMPSIVPQKGTFLDFNIKKAILKKIEITEQDKEDYEIVQKQEEEKIVWNIQKDMEKPLVIEFTPEELKYLEKACTDLSDKEMPDEIWGVAERIYNEIQK